MNFDIVIIGGGFAGLTSALSLAKANQNLQIALLEKNDIINFDKKRDGRTFAISKSSLDLFKAIGIWEELEKNSGKINQIRILDGKSPFYLHFGDDESSPQDLMGIVVENFHIHNALRNQALKQSNIKIIAPNFYTDIEFVGKAGAECHAPTKVVVTLNDVVANGDVKTNQITAKLLLAADGRMSPLREKFNIRFSEKSYGQTAIVFNISHAKSHNNIAIEKFLPEGPFATLPMKSDLESGIVWTVQNEMADVYFGLDEENFIHELQKRLDNYLGEVKILDKPFKYPLNLVLSSKYYFEKMALVGDAAHGIHPIAGQGFNVGVTDIKVLTELVKEYFENGLDIGSETLLQTYEKRRKFGAGKMIMATDSLNALFSNKILPVKIIRDLGLAMVEKIPSLKKFFIKNAGGL